MRRISCFFCLCIFAITHAFSQWGKIESAPPVQALSVNGDGIFAGRNNQLYKSQDEGDTWVLLSAFDTEFIETIEFLKGFMFVGMTRGCFDSCPERPSIYKSTDNGLTWAALHSSQFGTTKIIPFNDKVFANTIPSNSKGFLIVSENNGDTWQIVTSIGDVFDFAAGDTVLFATKNDGSMYRSFDQGSTWQFIQNGFFNRLIVAEGSTLFIYTDPAGIYRSIDDGDTWEIASEGLPDDILITKFIWDNQYLFAISIDNRIFMTSPQIIDWMDITVGLEITGYSDIYDLSISNKYIFVSLDNGELWRLPFTPLNVQLFPEVDFLRQNFPNPFQSSTTIEYVLSKPGFITLTIYNAQGERVEVLYRGFQNSGKYEVEFNGAVHPEGIYFYSLSQNGFTESKAMILER